MLEADAVSATARKCASRAAASREKQITFFPLRTGESATCAHDAHTHEMLLRLVEACGIIFEAAAIANLIILTMHMGTTPSDDLLINSHFVAHAFQRLGTLDILHNKATEIEARGGTMA
eukprot:3916097-Pleurochrysis_carterae.AAC.3